MKILILIVFLFAVSFSATSAATCEFFGSSLNVYTCRFRNSTFLNADDSFVIEGIHMLGRTDDDVRIVTATGTFNNTFNLVPQQIFDHFRQLSQITISNVGLTELHQPWQNCTTLTHIFVINNQIRRLPGKIFEACLNLMGLSVMNSGIEEIDREAFNGLYFLRSLQLHGNRVRYLNPDILKPLVRVSLLNIELMGLERIHPHTFRELPYLSRIFLSWNNFTTIETGTFVNIPLLREIVMPWNYQLVEIQPLAFGMLDELKFLFLELGNLTELRSSSFSTLPRLRTLGIRGNGIARIERNFFQQLPAVSLVEADQNECVQGWIWRTPGFDDEAFLNRFEECFWRFEGSPPTTTLGASGLSLSIGLAATLLLLKLSV